MEMANSLQTHPAAGMSGPVRVFSRSLRAAFILTFVDSDVSISVYFAWMAWLTQIRFFLVNSRPVARLAYWMKVIVHDINQHHIHPIMIMMLPQLSSHIHMWPLMNPWFCSIYYAVRVFVVRFI